MNTENHFRIRLGSYSREVINFIAPVSGYQTLPGFYVIAHRGASYYSPENTMAAFELAAELKADMVELDVTLSRDKVPVVLHDPKLQRTTSGKGNISRFYLRELLELDAGSWFSPEFREVRIPQLTEVLEWAKNKIALNIEIKKEAVDRNALYGIEDRVVDLIKEFDMKHQVVVSSFSKRAIRRIDKIDPGIYKSWLLNQYRFGRGRAMKLFHSTGAAGLNLSPQQMRKQLMRSLMNSKTPVWVYTVDDKLLMKKVIRKGATGMFTNRPDILHQVITEWNG